MSRFWISKYSYYVYIYIYHYIRKTSINGILNKFTYEIIINGPRLPKKHTPFPEGCCSLGVSDIPPGSNFSMRWSTWSRTLNRCSLWHLNFVAPLELVAFFPKVFWPAKWRKASLLAGFYSGWWVIQKNYKMILRYDTISVYITYPYLSHIPNDPQYSTRAKRYSSITPMVFS